LNFLNCQTAHRFCGALFVSGSFSKGLKIQSPDKAAEQNWRYFVMAIDK